MSDHTSSGRVPGRPREFDVDTVAERAMQVFWSNGYHATSLPALLDATRISRGSLYAAFGDKHGLFLLALDRYIGQALVRLDGELNSGQNALCGLRTCIEGYIDRTTGAAGKRGCLVIATAMELASYDQDVSHRIDYFFKMMRRKLTATIVRAQAGGMIVTDIEAASLANMILCLLEGLRVVSKVDSGQDVSAIRTLLDCFTK